MNRMIQKFSARLATQDRAAMLNTAQTLWRIVSAPLSVTITAVHLSPATQGYFYIFFNVLALQSVLEAGVGFNLLKHLSLNQGAITIHQGSLHIEGAERVDLLDRIAITNFWLMVVAVFLFSVILPAGLFFMESKGPAATAVDWHMPWMLLVLSNALSLLLQPFSTALEASGQRTYVYKMRFFITVVTSIASWGALIAGLGLYSLFFSGMTGVVLGLIFFAGRLRRSLTVIYDFRRVSLAALRRFWGEQWRITTTWTLGYFYWNALPLVFFKALGPVAAGQYGMTSAMLSAISQVASAPYNARIAQFGAWIGNGRKAMAIGEFEHTVRRSAGMYVAGVLSLAGCWWLFPSFPPFTRLLEPAAYAALAAYAFLNFLIPAWATFSRLCRNEPFLYFSLATNIVFPVFIALVGYASRSVTVTLLCLLTLQFVFLPWARHIYRVDASWAKSSHRHEPSALGVSGSCEIKQ